jgi:hypothetical protein
VLLHQIGTEDGPHRDVDKSAGFELAAKEGDNRLAVLGMKSHTGPGLDRCDDICGKPLSALEVAAIQSGIIHHA